jgi:cytosine/adenosine deaminase-related metal-dependent hydrolase
MAQRLVIRRAALWDARGSAADVLVEDGRVAAISQAPLPYSPGDWDIEAHGRLVLPGLVDAHNHLERRLARGLNGAAGARGHPQLEEPLRGRFERALDHDDLLAAASLALAEAALAGTTTVFALCRAPGCVDGSLDRLAEAAEAIGIRVVLAYGCSYRDGAFTLGVQENARFCEARKAHPLVRGMVGVTHPDDVGDAALDALAELVSRHGLHLHSAETETELAQGFHTYGRRTLERLGDLGLLNGRTLAAHLNHVSRRETLTLADAGATCVFTPRAALFAEERPPRLEALLDAGPHGALGTDGVASDVAAELSFGFALWRRTARPLAWQGFYALERLAVGGTRLAHRVFGSAQTTDRGVLEPGRLQVGDPADLALLEDYGATPAAGATPGSGSIVQLAQVMGSARVAWTVVGGRVLVREGELLGQDLRQLSTNAYARAEQVWKRL